VSRTDNTDPDWLRAMSHPRGYLYHSCSNIYRWQREALPCDANLPRPRSKGEAQDRNCGWTMPYSSYVSPSRQDCRIYWWGPERRREREDLRDMAREWNSTGEIESDDFPNYHHRNSAKWEIW
jgi:hypothetical protein